MVMRVDVRGNGLHPLKMILAAQASTFILLLLGILLTGCLSIGEAASGTSHDRNDLQELLEKLEASLTSLSSHSAVASCSGSECHADADGRSAARASAALASSDGGSDASRRDDDGAPLPTEVSRTSQILDARKTPLVARLKLIEHLLRQEQQHEQREQDYQPPIADEQTEVVLARGFDRHGRLFGEIPSAPAVRRMDQDRPAGQDQLEGLSAAGDPHGSNGEQKAGEQDGGRFLSLLAKLLLQQQQHQPESGGQQQPQESQHPSRTAAAADSAPDPPSSASRSSDSKPLQQELMTSSPPPPPQPSPQQSDQQHDVRQQTLADAVMQLISVVRDIAEDEQRIRAENEEMLDTVVSIAALEARHRLADDRRTRLEAAVEA